MISEVYDALLAAGAPEDKARKAAEAIYEHRMNALRADMATLRADLRLLKWQAAAILVFVLALFWKLFGV